MGQSLMILITLGIQIFTMGVFITSAVLEHSNHYYSCFRIKAFDWGRPAGSGAGGSTRPRSWNQARGVTCLSDPAAPGVAAAGSGKRVDEAVRERRQESASR